MNPLRWEVLALGFVLAVPVFALGLRGDFTTEETVSRLPWCLLAAWVAVALLRAVAAPPALRTGPGPSSGTVPDGSGTVPDGAEEEQAVR